MNDLANGWEWVTLEELGVAAQPGFASGKHNRDKKGIVHLRPMNINRLGMVDTSDVRYVVDDSTRRVRSNDVLFNNTNSPALVGKTALVTSHAPLAYSNHMTRLRPPNGVVSAFLAHQLHWLWTRGYFRDVLSHHVNQASVSSQVLLQTRIAIPGTAEQRRVVAALENHLSAISGGLASLQAVRRKADLFAAAERTEVFRISAHGRVVHLREILREPLRNGYSGRATANGCGVRIITLTAVTMNQFSEKNTKLCETGGRDVSGLWLERGDILIQRANTPELVGTAALYSGDEKWSIFPDLLIRVRTNDEIIPEFLSMTLSTSRVREYFKSSAKGLAGTMPKIDQNTVGNVTLCLPSLDTQREIVDKIREIDRVAMKLSADLELAKRKAERLRMSLLTEGFAGRLVPQDPDDEPASVLLKRIQTERVTQPKPKRTRLNTNADQERML